MGSVQRIDHRSTLWVLLIRCFKWVTLHSFSWVIREWEMAFSNLMNFRGTARRQLRALRVRRLRLFLTPKTYTENALSLWTVFRLLVAATSWKVCGYSLLHPGIKHSSIGCILTSRLPTGYACSFLKVGPLHFKDSFDLSTKKAQHWHHDLTIRTSHRNVACLSRW